MSARGREPESVVRRNLDAMRVRLCNRKHSYARAGGLGVCAQRAALSVPVYRVSHSARSVLLARLLSRQRDGAADAAGTRVSDARPLALLRSDTAAEQLEEHWEAREAEEVDDGDSDDHSDEEFNFPSTQMSCDTAAAVCPRAWAQRKRQCRQQERARATTSVSAAVTRTLLARQSRSAAASKKAHTTASSSSSDNGNDNSSNNTSGGGGALASTAISPGASASPKSASPALSSRCEFLQSIVGLLSSAGTPVTLSAPAPRPPIVPTPPRLDELAYRSCDSETEAGGDQEGSSMVIDSSVVIDDLSDSEFIVCESVGGPAGHALGGCVRPQRDAGVRTPAMNATTPTSHRRQALFVDRTSPSPYRLGSEVGLPCVRVLSPEMSTSSLSEAPPLRPTGGLCARARWSDDTSITDPSDSLSEDDRSAARSHAAPSITEPSNGLSEDDHDGESSHMDLLDLTPVTDHDRPRVAGARGRLLCSPNDAESLPERARAHDRQEQLRAAAAVAREQQRQRLDALFDTEAQDAADDHMREGEIDRAQKDEEEEEAIVAEIEQQEMLDEQWAIVADGTPPSSAEDITAVYRQSLLSPSSRTLGLRGFHRAGRLAGARFRLSERGSAAARHLHLPHRTHNRRHNHHHQPQHHLISPSSSDARLDHSHFSAASATATRQQVYPPHSSEEEDDSFVVDDDFVEYECTPTPPHRHRHHRSSKRPVL
jgi:hypothetical protein